MNHSKSQLNSKSDVRTNIGKSISRELDDAETPSTLSTRTRNSFKSAFFNFMRDFKQEHRNKDYKTLMRLGSRRWHSMTQADRAPYVLEAARNRRTARSESLRTSKSQSRPNKKKQNPKEKKSEKRCPICGHRKSSRERRRRDSLSDSSNSSRSRSRSRIRSRSRTRSRSHRSTKSKSSNRSKKSQNQK